MKKLKTLTAIITLVFIGILWYRWSYPDSWQRLLFPLEYKESIAQASEKYLLDPYLIAAIIYVESKFDPVSESRNGAVGLMQVMPNTGSWIATKQGRKFSPGDLYRPEENIDMGCWYFNFLLGKYKDERLALAAYNSGYKNVDRWLRIKRYKDIDAWVENIPFGETKQFVKRVQKTKKIYQKNYPHAFRELPGQETM